MDEDINEPKKSKYNSAVAQIFRLDNLWQQANYYSPKGMLVKWNWTLDVIWRELAGDCDPKDEEDYKKLNDEVNKKFNKKSEFYAVLNKKEIFLRRLQNKQGKGSAYYDPEEDWLEE